MMENDRSKIASLKDVNKRLSEETDALRHELRFLREKIRNLAAIGADRDNPPIQTVDDETMSRCEAVLVSGAPGNPSIRITGLGT
jgi:hypothetical protein